MNLNSAVISLLLFVQAASRDDIPPGIRADVESLMGFPPEKRLDSLAVYGDEYRVELLKWAKIWIALKPPEEPDASYFEVFLFHLGDEEILARGAAMYARGDYTWQQVFKHGRNPAVIPALVPTMNDDRLIDLKGQGFTPPFAATETIVLILQNAPQFSPEVRAWARNAMAMGDFYQSRAIMQEWWQQNEQHFKDRDYLAVRPGRTALVEPANSKGEPPLVAPAPEPLLSTIAPLAAAPVASAAETSTPSIATLWTCAAAVIALLVSLVVFWKRRA